MESGSQDQQSEFCIVVKEIMCLQKERRELLASLTPGGSVWKQRPELGGQEYTLVSRFAGKDYWAAAPVQDQVLVQDEMETESGQLGRYIDSIFEDMEDLSHRMLSMAYVVMVKTPPSDDPPLFSYMADELDNSAYRLAVACNELYQDTNAADDQQAGVVEENTVEDFCDRFLLKPWNYVNELALVVTKEEDEDYKKEVEKENKRAEEAKKEYMEVCKRWEEKKKLMKKMLKLKLKLTEKEKEEEEEKEKEKEEKEKEEKEKEKATMEYLKKGMESEEQFFADERADWSKTWGSNSTRCGDFFDKTTLSPMHFTHYTDDTIASSCGVTGSTLQIYSIEILELKGLKWPLKLYGEVAARDTVDRNRNIVFSRSSLDYQELDENGCLCLTGPSRAIVALDYVDFEVELKIEEGDESQGKELITLSKRYDGTGTSLMLEGSLCTAVLKLEKLSRAVQATIVGVSVSKGEWPFNYGCRVACCLAAAADEVVLLDCRGGSEEVHVGPDGYLHLSRNVVSVQLGGKLSVVIQSYLESGRAAPGTWKFEFTAQKCQTSELDGFVGTVKVKVVVAWSLLVKEKRDLLVNCPAVEP